MIRQATYEDIEQLVWICRWFKDEAVGYMSATLNADDLKYTFKGLMQHEDAAILVSVDDSFGGTDIVGLAVVVATPLPFNHSLLYAQEVLWYVIKQHRNGTLGKELFDAMEKWVNDKGCYALAVGAPPSNPGVGTYYTSRGYIQKETCYIKEFTKEAS
jgi:GNAT superfamily N-acetyltransferase